MIAPRRPRCCRSLTLPSCPGDGGRSCAQVLHCLADALLHPGTSPAAQPEQQRAILHAISEVRPRSGHHVYGYTPWCVSLDGGRSQRAPLLCPVTTMLRCVTSGRVLHPVDVWGEGGGRMHEGEVIYVCCLDELGWSAVKSAVVAAEVLPIGLICLVARADAVQCRQSVASARDARDACP